MNIITQDHTPFAQALMRARILDLTRVQSTCTHVHVQLSRMRLRRFFKTTRMAGMAWAGMAWPTMTLWRLTEKASWKSLS